MAIEPDDIARVRESTDIVALISEYIGLKQQGRRYVGLCPFHNEKTASFSVNSDEGLYYCFGCHRSGDAITFVEDIENLSFPEAVQKLAERSGITLKESSSKKTTSTLVSIQDALVRAIDFYHKKLLEPASSEAYKYLQSRGFNDDIIEMFYLGFAPDEWDALAKHLRIPGTILKASGLGFVNKAGRQQDFMRNRIIFPIYDPGGHPIAMGGRVLPGSKEAKYKNSPETLLYSKKKTLYGLHLAKTDIVHSDQAIICEGYTDVISFFKSGLPRAVATCGTALSEEHFKLLRRFTSNIVLAYDSDQAGQAGQERFYQWENTGDVNVSVAVIPEGYDPAELSLSDPQALRDSVERAVPFMRFRLERIFATHDLSHPEGRARAATTALENLSVHANRLLQDQYLMLISDRCKININTLRKEFDAVNKQKYNLQSRSPGNKEYHASRQVPHRNVGRDIQGTPPLRETRARSNAENEINTSLGGKTKEGVEDENRTIEDIYSNPECRAELEVLRIAIHNPQEVAEFIEGYLFDNDTLREVYELLANSQTLQQAIDSAYARSRTIANLLTRLAVEEPKSPPLGAISRLAIMAAERSIQDIQAQVRMNSMDTREAAQYITRIKIALEKFGEENASTEPLRELIKLLQTGNNN